MTADHRELDDLQTAARELFADLASSTAVHDLIDAPGRDGALESRLVDLGFYTVLLPGAGGTLEHLMRIVTEAGSATATTRLLGHGVGVGVGLSLAPDSPARERALTRVAAGAYGAVVGLSAGAFHHLIDGDGWVLQGVDTLALDVDGAEVLLLWSDGEDGTRLWSVEASDLDITVLATIDRTRILADVSAPIVPTTNAVLLASGGEAASIRHGVALALETAIAHDSLGVARRALDLTVDYVRTREQFGRPVGSFQAVKHQAADMAVRTELAQSICDAALRAVLDDAPGATATVAMAREIACRDASLVAGRAIQLHGGIGYTWEHDAHILLKRAKLNEALITSSGDRRAVLLQAIRGMEGAS